jgi:diguanylate cyclase (GGDEF)-like protein
MNMIDDAITTLIHQLLDACPAGALALDAGGRISWVNPSLTEMLGPVAGELPGAQRSALPAVLAPLLDDSDRVTIAVPDEREQHLVRSHVGPLADGTHVYYFTDCTPDPALERRLHRLALADPVTGLMNQRAIMMLLEPQVARSRRYSNPLSVVALALQFAAGHPSDGQQYEQLRSVSGLLKDQLRWADIIGRDDAGNFSLILPETPLEAARTLTEKVARALEADPQVASFRFGVAEWGKTDSAATLLARAAAELEPSGGPAGAAAAAR